VAATTWKNSVTVLALAGLTLLANPLHAATIRVGAGGIHTTIAAGLAAAQPGDTVLVAEGL
jgi:hypothetical protein